MKFKFLPWEQDEWSSTQGTILKYDKLEHFLMALSGTLTGAYILKLSYLSVSLFIFILGLVWEIKDGITKNGQGFSWKDLIADLMGILIAYLFLINV